MQRENLKKEATVLLWARGWAIEEIAYALSKSKKWVVKELKKE